jgi:hypothetical protein
VGILAILCLLAAIAAFLVETFRTGFGLIPFGLALVSAYFLIAFAIPAINS